VTKERDKRKGKEQRGEGRTSDKRAMRGNQREVQEREGKGQRGEGRTSDKRGKRGKIDLEQEDKTQRREGRTPEKGGTRGERKRRERGERDRIKQKGKRGNLALTDRPDQASKIFIELFSTLNQAQPPTF
jgi:hypothetical protein